MKKIISLLILLLMGFMLAGCKLDENVPDDTPKTYEKTLFPSSCCQAATDLGDGWVPVWCDEFEGETVDLTKWNLVDDVWRNNEELQYYSPDNIFVEDGKLVIEARKETLSDKEYTSGRMNTQYKGDWLYGRVIVRAKMPSGRGTWPGIWMMPTESVYGEWPNSGEIDIMEYVGFDQNMCHGTVHTSKYNWTKNTHTMYSMLWPSVEEVFVNYEMVWEPGLIKLFVDGELLGSFAYIAENEQTTIYHQAWPFDQPFYFILNLAIGGPWAASEGIDDDAFPTRLEVDYVRVYQRDYPYVDRQAPNPIETIIQSQSMYKYMVYWDVPEDDYEIEYYEIYIDGELHQTSTVNSCFIKGLSPRTNYLLEVVAVDFAGNKSLPTALDFSYGW
ncbi:MAG: glycoside hydrolase family 16 protein [Bacilli bacterium]|nr:glycoside hydrolase family 16 protein [Bacilli bacterium]MDY0063991.1 glycoside hydrolase family 16 protein [Bacilli bacterium]